MKTNHPKKHPKKDNKKLALYNYKQDEDKITFKSYDKFSPCFVRYIS